MLNEPAETLDALSTESRQPPPGAHGTGVGNGRGVQGRRVQLRRGNHFSAEGSQPKFDTA
jgi:hypothetical protein